MAKPATLPYWLSTGSERCGGCHHFFVLETVYRCTGCDTAVCVCCAAFERETRHVWCPECHADSANVET